LQADGWWLRQDIIWHKPNPMPESVTDRCTKAHEYLFLMTKSAKYYYDADAIREPAIESNTARPRMGQGPKTQYNQKRNRATFRGGGRYVNNNSFDNAAKAKPTDTGMAGNVCAGRNKRSVWTINTKPYRDAHFATFPEELPKICIMAGCPEKGVVLDPFTGSGTVGKVAEGLGRNSILIELNPAYIDLIKTRTAQQGML